MNKPDEDPGTSIAAEILTLPAVRRLFPHPAQEPHTLATARGTAVPSNALIVVQRDGDTVRISLSAGVSTDRPLQQTASDIADAVQALTSDGAAVVPAVHVRICAISD